MEHYLKEYMAAIRIETPVFIGSGQKLGKKEYIHLLEQKTVIVPEFQKLYKAVERKHLERDYILFMDPRTKDPLSKWLRDKGFKDADLASLEGYHMDAGDAFIAGKDRGKESTPKNIDCFMKDPYGMPYVPGTSIKGMLRTCLLARELINLNEKEREQIRTRIRSVEETYGKKNNRKTYLRKETENLEARIFHTLDRVPEKRNNAVNSCMSGLIVSDSGPLSVKDLILSQKIDVTLDGVEKPLPILRETLKPGTEVGFTITIDRKLFPYSLDDLHEAVQLMGELCQDRFYDRFGFDTYCDGAVWLGGGAGFLSKTIIYALFDGEEAVRITDQIFRNTLGNSYSVHKHEKDIQSGIAPHVCKCTRYDGRLLPMGKGTFMIRE